MREDISLEDYETLYSLYIIINMLYMHLKIFGEVDSSLYKIFFSDKI